MDRLQISKINENVMCEQKKQNIIYTPDGIFQLEKSAVFPLADLKTPADVINYFPKPFNGLRQIAGNDRFGPKGRNKNERGTRFSDSDTYRGAS